MSKLQPSFSLGKSFDHLSNEHATIKLKFEKFIVNGNVLIAKSQNSLWRIFVRSLSLEKSDTFLFNIGIVLLLQLLLVLNFTLVRVVHYTHSSAVYEWNGCGTWNRIAAPSRCNCESLHLRAPPYAVLPFFAGAAGIN